MWGGVLLLLLLIILSSCSENRFTPIWRLCGITARDTAGNEAVVYEGSDSASFNVKLKSSESYSITFTKTEDGAVPEEYDIALICDGHDFLQGSYAGLHVVQDGGNYIFTQIPSSPKIVDIRISIDGVEIGYITIEISREFTPPRPEPEPETPVVTFDTDTDSPETVSIISSVEGASIHYTLDGTDPTSASPQYLEPLDISDVSGDKTLKAKAFNGTAESDIAVLDLIIKDSTYIIYSEDGLRKWASSMPSNAPGGVPGILGKDIVLPSIDEGNGNWTPIYEYTGTLDGRNHTISGLTVKNVYYAAFFEVLDGTVKNLKLADVDVDGSGYAGGIAGAIYGGTISDCSVSGTVNGRDYGYAGGIAGSASGGSISDSVSSATVSGYESGGIIGTTGSGDTVSISDCSVSGTITSDRYAGGISGRAKDMVIAGCTNSATVSGGYCAGGIAGTSENSSSIIDCTNNGAVSGDSRIGGIVGLNASSEPIESCENYGEIKGTGDYVGGIVGNTTSNLGTQIIECINSAPVSGIDRVGGICGSLTNDASIVGCRNEGEGTISGNSDVGGVAGYISSSEIMYSCNKMSITASSENAGGIAGGSARRLNSNIEGCYNTANIEAAQSSGGIIGDADPSDFFKACYSTGSAYYGIGGPEDGWGEGPSFSACYWSGQNGGGGGITISGIKQVSSWTEDIMNNLNNAITSPAQYLYEESDLQSTEPYRLVKQEATI